MGPDFTTLLNQAYGLTGTELEPLSGGMDASARVYKWDTDEGAWLVKWNRGQTLGPRCCAALAEAGLEFVPRPLLTQQGTVTASLLDGHVSVTRFLVGHNGFERALDLEKWRALGAALRQLHAVESPSVKILLSAEQWAVPEADAAFLNVVCATADPIGREVEATLAANWDGILERCAELRRLGEECRAMNLPLVPVHADIHPGNVLVSEAGNLTLIDWDRARLSAVECDLAFFWERGMVGTRQPDEEAAFWSGYGAVDVVRPAIAYFRLARVVEDIVSFTQEAADASRNPQDRTESLEWLRRQFTHPGP